MEEINNKRKSNPLAIAGFISSLCSILFTIISYFGLYFLGVISWLIGLIGIIFSSIGLAQVKKTGTGKGYAITGLIFGIICMLFLIAEIVITVLMIASLF